MKKQFSILILIFSLSPFSHAVVYDQYKFSSAEENFKIAMDKILQQYVDKGIAKEDLYRAATAGMLKSLNSGENSWNTLLTPYDLKEIQSDLSGQVTGIGIELKFDNTTGYAQIVGVIPNSPSEKSGIKRDDQILSVNGERYKGKQFRDIVSAIRGKIGESVSLKILRDDKILSLKVKREVIPWTPVELSKVDDTTQLLTIGYFTKDTPKLVEDRMGGINAGSVKNLVIDLRNNSGGSFEKAVQTAELFVAQGKTIVATKDRDEKIQTFASKKGLLRKDMKVIIITNGQTSSGAELFAGALKEELNAKIVGEKTLGKWNAQMIETLPNGFAIKFTTQGFQTPSGNSYQNIGLKPDVEVSLAKDVEARELRTKYDVPKRLEFDTQLKAATELVKAM